MTNCQHKLRDAGKPYPRTCAHCGLFSPCLEGLDREQLLATLAAVKPLDFANCLKHAFLAGVVAARNIPGHEPCDGQMLWTEYEPYEPGSYSNIVAALKRN